MGEIDHLGPKANAFIRGAVASEFIFGALAVACEPKPQVDPSGNSSEPNPALVTSAPELSDPVSSSGTPIVEVDQSGPEIPVDELVTSFGLRETPGYEDRTFGKQTIDGVEYLVDGYNNAPKLINENGTWRELDRNNPTDAEVMYGKMVQKGGVYILPDEITGSSSPTKMLINPIILGDWEVGKADYNGEQISMYYIFAGLRDKSGNLRIVRLAYDSPDTKHDHLTTNWCKYDNRGLLMPASGDQIWGTLQEQLKWLKPGEVTGVDIFQTNAIPSEEYWQSPDSPKYNTMQWVLMTDLNNQHPELYQLTADERAAMKQGEWPDRPVTLALVKGAAVSRSSEANCK